MSLPFVLLGTNTDKKYLKQIDSGTRFNGTDKSQNTLPTHMVRKPDKMFLFEI